MEFDDPTDRQIMDESLLQPKFSEKPNTENQGDKTDEPPKQTLHPKTQQPVDWGTTGTDLIDPGNRPVIDFDDPKNRRKE